MSIKPSLELDIGKLKYDLSIEYAKASLAKAMKSRNIYDAIAPESINELEYLLSEFSLAYDYYTNCVGGEQIKNRILNP